MFCFYFLFIYGNVESNPGPLHTRQRNYHILSSNIHSLHANINDLAVSSNYCDILFCFETLVSQMRHIQGRYLATKSMGWGGGDSENFAVNIRRIFVRSIGSD